MMLMLMLMLMLDIMHHLITIVFNLKVNVNELLPVWFSLLPVWVDEEELPHIYGFLLSLVEM